MDLGELMKGNLVNTNRGIGVVRYIVETHCAIILLKDNQWVNVDDHYITELPLTEDWLIKLGFRLFEETDICKEYAIGFNPITKDYLMIVKIIKEYGYFFYRNGHHKLETVHKLQNMYYVLSDEKLKLKQ